MFSPQNRNFKSFTRNQMAAAPAIGNKIRRKADKKAELETLPVSANAFSIKAIKRIPAAIPIKTGSIMAVGLRGIKARTGTLLLGIDSFSIFSLFIKALKGITSVLDHRPGK
ncbi:hypothetical protein CW306_13755 [Bacillus sp. BA3]|nr:hypothetical protein CW306_13755 [Bacillus sp. BA3]